MSESKFKPGQTVRIILGPRVSAAPGSFKIVRILPTERGIIQYRIKSETDGHERVVTEGEVA
jgi:hypothetical protein